jgi:hypothetical protein
VLVIIALFVTLAPMLSQFTYFDTDWGMMSSAPDTESGHYFGTDFGTRPVGARGNWRAHLADGRHCGGVGGGGRWYAVWFSCRATSAEKLTR